MLGVLTSILCVLRNLLLAIAYAGVELVNLLVAGIAALAAGLLALLPTLPAVPDLPGAAGDAPRWLAWSYPVADVLTAFASLLSLYLIFLGVRIGLRWVKAL